MATSSVKHKLSKGVTKVVDKSTGSSGATSDSESDNEDIAAIMAAKYMLRVTAGPSYDPRTHKPVFVNTETPTSVENEWVNAKIKVRIRGYEGLPRGSKSHSDYFDTEAHSKDQYSIGFSFVPKKDFGALDTVWGNDFDHPVRDRLPPTPIFNTAWKIFTTFIDPGVSCDAYCDEPWLYGPTLSTWFTMRIGDKLPSHQHADHPHPPEHLPLEEGGDGSGLSLRYQHQIPHDNQKRRKHFLKESNRSNFIFEAGRLYQGDFYNPYIDFNKFKLRLPGFSISVIRYINDKTHHLRYVFKNVRTDDVYFVVVFTLLHGNDVDVALREEGEREALEVSRLEKSSVVVDGEEFVDANDGLRDGLLRFDSKSQQEQEAHCIDRHT